jgi:hypothetical protein
VDELPRRALPSATKGRFLSVGQGYRCPRAMAYAAACRVPAEGVQPGAGRRLGNRRMSKRSKAPPSSAPVRLRWLEARGFGKTNRQPVESQRSRSQTVTSLRTTGSGEFPLPEGSARPALAPEKTADNAADASDDCRAALRPSRRSPGARLRRLNSVPFDRNEPVTTCEAILADQRPSGQQRLRRRSSRRGPSRDRRPFHPIGRFRG